MEQYLKETYGITVYQEQIMLLSQKLANFTPSLSNSLRKAIGKNQKDVLEWLEIQFYEGGLKNGHSKETLAQIWNDWVTEGRLCFNKSHAVSYSWVAYQSAYLKAHYPVEYMTTLISQVHDDKSRFEQLVKDCQANGLYVEDDSPIFTIGKGINVSIPHFTVRRQQENGTTK
jgi:DNA polymerase-3 subunit alpha